MMFNWHVSSLSNLPKLYHSKGEFKFKEREQELPTKYDLKQIPRWTVVAFAARWTRCAYSLIEKDSQYLENLDNIISVAENAAATATVPSMDAARFASRILADITKKAKAKRKMKIKYAIENKNKAIEAYRAAVIAEREGTDQYALMHQAAAVMGVPGLARVVAEEKTIEAANAKRFLDASAAVCAAVCIAAYAAIRAARSTRPSIYATRGVKASLRATAYAKKAKKSYDYELDDSYKHNCSKIQSEFQSIRETAQLEKWNDETPVPPSFFRPCNITL